MALMALNVTGRYIHSRIVISLLLLGGGSRLIWSHRQALIVPVKAARARLPAIPKVRVSFQATRN